MAKKVPRISTKDVHGPAPSVQNEEAALFQAADLRKKNVNDLLVLLEKTTGRKMSRKTRKTEIIQAILDQTQS